MKRGPKIIYLRRKVLAAVGCLAAAVLMCWVITTPKVVGVAECGSRNTNDLQTGDVHIDRIS